MNNEFLHPFKDLEFYLQNIDSELDSFYNSFNIESFAPRITIDKVNMSVSMLKDSYKDNKDCIQIFNFSREAGYRIQNFLAHSFNNVNIALEFQQKIGKNNIISYLDSLNSQISNSFTQELLDSYSFLSKYKDIALQNITDYLSNVNKQSQRFPPLEFINEGGENPLIKTEKLYYLLTSSSLISCSKENFMNAFTPQGTENGISWLAKSSKNNTTNKPLLVYLFRELLDKKHIKSTYLSYENYYLTTIFRNNDGSKFSSQQLSSSKYSMSDNKFYKSSQETLIDDIVSQL